MCSIDIMIFIDDACLDVSIGWDEQLVALVCQSIVVGESFDWWYVLSDFSDGVKPVGVGED
jgi:hypothetical protein